MQLSAAFSSWVTPTACGPGYPDVSRFWSGMWASKATVYSKQYTASNRSRQTGTDACDGWDGRSHAPGVGARVRLLFLLC